MSRRNKPPKRIPAPDAIYNSVDIAIRPILIKKPADEYNSNAANIAKAVQMLGGADAAGTPLWWDAKDHSVDNN